MSASNRRRLSPRARLVPTAPPDDADAQDPQLTRMIPWLVPGLALLLCFTIWLVWATDL